MVVNSAAALQIHLARRMDLRHVAKITEQEEDVVLHPYDNGW